MLIFEVKNKEYIEIWVALRNNLKFPNFVGSVNSLKVMLSSSRSENNLEKILKFIFDKIIETEKSIYSDSIEIL